MREDIGLPPLEFGTRVLVGIVGSKAYGLDTPSSDTDLLGVYAAPTRQLHGLHPPSDKGQSHVTHEPDVTFHEVLKYAHLSLKCNPTTNELMWLPPAFIAYTSILGEELREIRTCFLSEEPVKKSYYGYCNQQLARIQRRRSRYLDPDDDGDTRHVKIAKHARHLKRLSEQLYSLWHEGTIPIRVNDRAAVFDFGERVADGDDDALINLLDGMRDMVDRTPSVLPEYPSERPIETWLQRVRRYYYVDGY